MNKTKLQKEVGARIRKIREEKGISHEELAISIGKLRTALYRIEAGGVNPSIYTLRQIAGGLGVKLEELLKELNSL